MLEVYLLPQLNWNEGYNKSNSNVKLEHKNTTPLLGIMLLLVWLKLACSQSKLYKILQLFHNVNILVSALEQAATLHSISKL
jgi:hypothetical protein